MASRDKLSCKMPATESSIDSRLCLVSEGDKFTNINGDHHVEQLRQPGLESHQPW